MAHTTAGRLFLVRHGQSTFNADNLFTGFSDPPLTPQGEAEAVSVGRRLKAGGVDITAAFSSGFERTIRSGEIILHELGSDVPLHAEMALNERSYGELTGLNKAEAAARFGEDQVRKWRRGYADQPPGGESLRDALARILPYYLHAILPAALRGADVLVVGHGNTIRAMITGLENLPPLAVQSLEVGTGEIVQYEVAPDATVRRAHLLDLPTP